MSQLQDFAQAAAEATKAPFPIVLLLTIEGVDVMARSGDEELNRLCTWSELDGAAPMHLTHVVKEVIETVRREREDAIEEASGARPIRPPRRLP